MKIARWMFALVALTMIQQVQAGLLELRAGVGLNAADPHAFEDRVNSISGQDLSAKNFDNYNADVMLHLPVLPIGIGLRQEWIQQQQSSGGDKWKLDAKNISVLVDWRIINTLVYLGPIVSIGYPSAKVDFNSGSTATSDKIKSGEPSYALGAEVGVKLALFIIGAEAGYSSLKLDKHSTDNTSVQTPVDLSGFYGKLMVGISLF